MTDGAASHKDVPIGISLMTKNFIHGPLLPKICPNGEFQPNKVNTFQTVTFDVKSNGKPKEIGIAKATNDVISGLWRPSSLANRKSWITLKWHTSDGGCAPTKREQETAVGLNISLFTGVLLVPRAATMELFAVAEEPNTAIKSQIVGDKQKTVVSSQPLHCPYVPTMCFCNAFLLR